MADGDGGSPALVRANDFEGELEEHWEDAAGRKVVDKSGDEVGTLEDLYVWEDASTVHLLKVSGEAGSVLLPVHAVTDAGEEEIQVEESKETIEGAPGHDSDDVPDEETRKAAFTYYGYTDPLDVGGA